MNDIYEKLMRCYDSFRKKINFKPEVAIVLGSGLGDYAENIQIEAELDYSEIEAPDYYVPDLGVNFKYLTVKGASA